MAKDKIAMPSGVGGLVRYGVEDKELIQIKPKYVVAIAFAVVALEIVLRIAF